MMHDWLGFHKVFSHWVPRQLTPQYKSQRMGLSLQHFQHYQDERDDMLSRIVIWDESWVHRYELERKRVSMKHPASPVHKKFVTPSARKVMLTVFWDCQGVLLTQFQQRDHTVTSASYCTILTKLVPSFAGSDQASSLKGCCCCMTTPVLIVAIRPQGR